MVWGWPWRSSFNAPFVLFPHFEANKPTVAWTDLLLFRNERGTSEKVNGKKLAGNCYCVREKGVEFSRSQTGFNLGSGLFTLLKTDTVRDTGIFCKVTERVYFFFYRIFVLSFLWRAQGSRQSLQQPWLCWVCVTGPGVHSELLEPKSDCIPVLQPLVTIVVSQCILVRVIPV